MSAFRYNGKTYHQTLKTESEREANALLGHVEENLILLERGKLAPPPDGNLGLFLLTDGKITDKPKVAESVTLSTFFRRYRAEFTAGAKEKSTLYTETIHLGHLERIIGPRTGVRSITMEVMQRYVDSRAKEIGRNGLPVSQVTIKKEIGSFSSVWNRWGVVKGLVSGPAPTTGLIFPKTKSKLPFITLDEIEQRVHRGGLSPEEKGRLWESVFLNLSQIDECLTWVKEHSRFGFLYPAFVFITHTGSRRGELLRAEVTDFDFRNAIVRIREKKRDRTKDFTIRTVPMSPLLMNVMKDWFGHYPGGRYAFCERVDEPLSPQMITHHFPGRLRVVAGQI